MKKNHYPLVSVIIPTRNSIRTIEIALKSFFRQTYQNREIIVVDQESRDGTVEVAKKYHSKVLSTKGDRFYSAPPVSRNLGTKASKGKYLLHLDSDMELTPPVLTECVELLEKNPKILAVKIHEKDEGSGFWSNAKMLERKCYVDFAMIESARFIRRTIFDKLGGYDEDLRSAEDWDMSQRIAKRGQIGVANSFIIHHVGQMNYFYQVKKKFNYGLTLARILKKHKFDTKKSFAMVFRSTYMKNWQLFVKNPLATLGFIILRSSELLAYLAGIVWAKINKISV